MRRGKAKSTKCWDENQTTNSKIIVKNFNLK